MGFAITDDFAATFASTHPEIRITGLPPVVREPIPEVVVKPEPVAKVNLRRFCQASKRIPIPSSLQKKSISSPRSNPSLKHAVSLATAPKRKRVWTSVGAIAEAFPEGDEDWWTILPGDPTGSLLVERIKLSEDDDGAMPPRGERLTEEEILIIEQWIARGEPPVDQARLVPR